MIVPSLSRPVLPCSQVVTAQYFAWYFSLLPLLLPHIAWPVPKGLVFALVGWALAQVHWLGWAYALEFQVSYTVVLCTADYSCLCALNHLDEAVGSGKLEP